MCAVALLWLGRGVPSTVVPSGSDVGVEGDAGE